MEAERALAGEVHVELGRARPYHAVVALGQGPLHLIVVLVGLVLVLKPDLTEDHGVWRATGAAIAVAGAAASLSCGLLMASAAVRAPGPRARLLLAAWWACGAACVGYGAAIYAVARAMEALVGHAL